jgi:hypothetical protein|tara:strand:- start:784 stop:1128 length:345 start_codon:yes stop_codon:yes gene_type:complete
MSGMWVGIIFLINTAWVSVPPSIDSKGRLTEPPDVVFGLNNEYFKSEKICWEYFDNHPSFKVLDVYNRDYYDIESKIKRYVIKHVGTAYVACKEDTTTIQHGSFHKHIHDSHDK